MFELGALSPLNIQIQVEASGDEEKDDRIANQQVNWPIECQRLHRLQRWREIKPLKQRDRRIEQVPGQHVTVVAEKPLCERFRLRRPNKERRIP